MSIEFQTELRTNYVYVRCSGIRSSPALMDVFENAFHIAESNKCAAVLVDIRDVTGSVPTTMERYEQGVHAATLQQARYGGIAIAVVGHEPFIDPESLAETVARNRGCIARTFTDIDEAVYWIEQKVLTACEAR